MSILNPASHGPPAVPASGGEFTSNHGNLETTIRTELRRLENLDAQIPAKDSKLKWKPGPRRVRRAMKKAGPLQRSGLGSCCVDPILGTRNYAGSLMVFPATTSTFSWKMVCPEGSRSSML